MDMLEELAPYPRSLENVTAAGLARYFAALAQRRLNHIGKPGNEVLFEAIHVLGYVHEYALAAVLRAFARAAPGPADDAARSVWRALDAGEMTGEHLWEWLVGYGIDPELLRDEVSG